MAPGRQRERQRERERAPYARATPPGWARARLAVLQRRAFPEDEDGPTRGFPATIEKFTSGDTRRRSLQRTRGLLSRLPDRSAFPSTLSRVVGGHLSPWGRRALEGAVAKSGGVLDIVPPCEDPGQEGLFPTTLVRRLEPFLDRDDLATVIHAVVISRLDYCNVFYMGLPLKTVRKLQLGQNAAGRLLTGTTGWTHLTSVLKELHSW